MEFIEMTGKQLFAVMQQDELNAHQIEASGIGDDTIVRVNRQGDLEVRRKDGWEILGGLLGDFEHRVAQETGLAWAVPLTGLGN